MNDTTKPNKPAADKQQAGAGLKAGNARSDQELVHSVRKLTPEDVLFLRQMEETELAQRFAAALLANARVEQVLGFNPLTVGRVSESGNAGTLLAEHTHRLARQYLDHLKKLTAGQ